MTSAVIKAYDFIKTSIMSGDLPAGVRVTEEFVSEKVGVSRTPIREALHKLATEGFVDMPPNQGARVVGWSKQDLNEITDLRAVLESFGAGVAARRISKENLEQLDRLCDQMEEAVSRGTTTDMENLTQLNSDFHMLIINSSGNVRLVDVIGHLAHPLLVQRRFSKFNAMRLQRSMGHHRELVEALTAKDAEWASTIMRSHILGSRQSI